MSNRILVVDDDRTFRDLVAGLLAKTYGVATAASGEDALAMAEQEAFALVTLDVRMPGIDGFETCGRLKSRFHGEHLQVIMISGESSEEEQVRALAVGADAYLVKPISPRVLQTKVRLHFRLRAAIRRLASVQGEPENATQDAAVLAMGKLTESSGEEAAAHLVRVRAYCQVLAEHLRRKSPYRREITERFLSDLYRSSPLHDAGKVGIADGLLLKPGRLTPEEFGIVKMHSVLGAATLQGIAVCPNSGSSLKMAVKIAMLHHERFDGSGYPIGLLGEEIPLPARIVALADAFDALTSQRPHRPAYSFREARRIVHQESGRHFDPVVVDAFDACFEEFVKIRQWHGEGVPAAADAADVPGPSPVMLLPTT